MPRTLLLVTVAAVLVGACASAASTTAMPETTVTPVTQRIVSSGSIVNLNTINVNSGRSTIIVTSMDAAWTALNVTYGELNIPITTLVDKDHLIANESIKTRRRFANITMRQLFDCGSTQGLPNAETYDIVMSIASTIVPNPKGGVNLMTRIDATGKSPNFSRDAAVTCQSTGALEKAIAESVRKKVGG